MNDGKLKIYAENDVNFKRLGNPLNKRKGPS